MKGTPPVRATHGLRSDYVAGCRCDQCRAAETAYQRTRRGGHALDDLTIAGSDIPLPGPWAAAGRCRTAPPNLFFPTSGGDTSQAKAICAGCTVIDDCRTYGLAHPQLHGVWGGLTGSERRAIRRQEPPVEIATPPPAPPRRGQPRRLNRGALYRTLEALADQHPGRWARVGHWPHPGTATTVASLCRTGRRRIPPGTWTFESRRADDGGSDLYARHDSEENEAAS